MKDSVYMRRFVHPESIRSLRFRHSAAKKFGHLGIKVVADGNLHSTTAHYRDFTPSMQDLALAMRQQPSVSERSTVANVVGADTFGRNRITRTSWFALTLANNELDEEYAHYQHLLGAPSHEAFTPHVTLFKTTRPTPPTAIREINDWVQNQAPSDIVLKPISVVWSSAEDKANLSSSPI